MTICHLKLDGAFGEIQFRGNLFVLEALRDEPQDFVSRPDKPAEGIRFFCKLLENTAGQPRRQRDLASAPPRRATPALRLRSGPSKYTRTAAVDRFEQILVRG